MEIHSLIEVSRINDSTVGSRRYDYRGVGIDYIHDGYKLISELRPNHRLDFLYEENDIFYLIFLIIIWTLIDYSKLSWVKNSKLNKTNNTWRT